MSSFFSLGGGNRSINHTPQSQNQNQNPENPLLQDPYSLYRHETIPYKSFELWQQFPSPSHHHHQHQNIYPNLLGSAPGLGAGPSREMNINLSDELSSRSGMLMMRNSGGGISCLDCGNQAKKDCPHMRCRTCCKSRGYECQTHLKSTWVPAAERRKRQQQLASLQQRQEEENRRQIGQRENSKRSRENTSGSSSMFCARLPSNSSGLESGNFPTEVNTQAIFRKFVSSIDDNEDQYAYQTTVNIGGHVFKGILHDQGPEPYRAGDSSSGGGSAGGGMQPLNLATTTATSAPRGGAAASPSPAAFLEPNLYSGPLNTFQAGTQFFPHSRS